MDSTEVKEKFIKEFSVINKNKFTLQQTKSLYLGLLYQLISNKTIFKKNKELEGFLKHIFNKEYGDYLFKARPYLASRLLKDISIEYDNLEISASIKAIMEYLNDKNMTEDIKTKPQINNSMEDEVIGWFNTVSKGNKKP